MRRARREPARVGWARRYVFRHTHAARDLEEKNPFTEAGNVALPDTVSEGSCAPDASEGTRRSMRGEGCPHLRAGGCRGAGRSLQAAARRSPRSDRALREDVTRWDLPHAHARRADWSNQAIRYFQRQDPARARARHLDGQPGLVEKDLTCDPRHSVREPAAAHEHRCDAAKPGVRDGARRPDANWDDDDWYGRRRLAAQLAKIAAGTRGLSGLVATPLFDVGKRRDVGPARPRSREPLRPRGPRGDPRLARRLFGCTQSAFQNVSLAER